MLEVYDLWERHDREQEKWLDSLPVCDKCKRPIQQDKAVYYNDQWICEDCEEEFAEEIKDELFEELFDRFWSELRKDYLERVED